MKLPHLLACAALALALTSCHIGPSKHDEAPRYTLLFLVATGDTTPRTKEEGAALMQGHMAQLTRLADEDKLLIAGPFGHPMRDDTLRGLCIFATESYDGARAWMAEDPTLKANVMRAEGGAFWSRAPLARVVQLDRAAKAEAAREGKELKLHDGIRGYALLLAKDKARAERAIRMTHAQDKLVFAGELQFSPRANYIAVLDAPDVEAAKQLFGGSFAELGDCEVVPWWSSKLLVELAPATASH